MAKKIAPLKKRASALNEKPIEKNSIISIDYPQENEMVIPGHYAIRISGLPNTDVEVSINGETWQPCRETVGHYWFDWLAEPGNTTLNVRSKDAQNGWMKSKERLITVAGSSRN